jgi:hypothetical protein
VPLAAAHQTGAVLLFVAALNATHALSFFPVAMIGKRLSAFAFLLRREDHDRPMRKRSYP